MKTKYNVSLRFILDQKDEEFVLQSIRNLFGYGKISLRKDRTNNTVYRYTIHSIKASKIVINYFNQFPLKTTKKHSFNI
jgi:hypothetical protein